MRKIITGLVLSLLASTSYAQDSVTFDIDFHTVYAASGEFAPTLAATAPGPFNGSAPIPPVNLSGQITLTTVASSARLAPGLTNTLTLDGSFTTESGWEPSGTWDTHTFSDAVFDFGTAVGEASEYVAIDFAGPSPDWPMLAGTASDGLMSDHGPMGSCTFFFGCSSANAQELFAPGTEIFDVTANGGLGASNFATYADAGFNPLIGGSATSLIDQGGIRADNGLDAISFDMVLEGGQVPQLGGIVRFVIFSDTASTAYMVEGSIVEAVPVPAAVWLFGSALGMLGWVRRRATAK